MLGNRSIKKILRAITGKQHYIALINMMLHYPKPLDNTLRYLTATGSYPYDIEIRTPTRTVQPRLYSSHDMLTANEIFCRLDYKADKQIKVVVDLGSNIGISALYFLSRNDESKCYLYEPDKRNVEKLKINLTDFQERYILFEKAVSHESGQLVFGVEPTGRYGGIGVNTRKKIVVECLEINDVIGRILDDNEFIDILKIDTEGVEIATVKGIKSDYLYRIKKIYLEAAPKQQLHPSIFKQNQYGSVCELLNKHI